MSMERNAVGFIETIGLVSMIAALDAMLKSASVAFVNYQSLDGQFTAAIAGDVSSVRHAIDVGVRRAKEVGEVVASRVISTVEDGMVQKFPILSEKTVSLRLEKPEDGLSRRLLGPDTIALKVKP